MLEFFKENKKALYLLAFYFCLILFISFFWPREIDWRPSYSLKHAKPFGNKVLFSELEYLFPESNLQESQKPIYNTAHDSLGHNGQGAYVFINTVFAPDSLELSKLFAYAEEGNTVFVSAEGFSRDLLDTLRVLHSEDFIYSQNNDSTLVHFVQSPFSNETFEFPNNQFERFFQADSLFEGSVLAYADKDEQINQFITAFGKGKFILNSYPLGFTNYNILKDQNSAYSSSCLSYLGEPRYLLWDEYYKVGRAGSSQTPLAEILKIPGLKWAYWISLCTMLLFIAVHAKRRQRIIPIQPALKNTTVEYAETMGNLYYEQADKKSIALKKIEYFKSFLFRKYKMQNIIFNDENLNQLHTVTNMSKEELEAIFGLVDKVRNSNTIDTDTLKSLIKGINKFYK